MLRLHQMISLIKVHGAEQKIQKRPLIINKPGNTIQLFIRLFYDRRNIHPYLNGELFMIKEVFQVCNHQIDRISTIELD